MLFRSIAENDLHQNGIQQSLRHSKHAISSMAQQQHRQVKLGRRKSEQSRVERIREVPVETGTFTSETFLEDILQLQWFLSDRLLYL